MANVYLAVARGPSGFNKLVVLKSLRSDLAGDPELLSMFLEEARLAARLNHPHVVQTYEVGDYAGRPVIVMEYLEGQTLGNVLQRAKGQMSLALHLRVIIDSLEGLHHAHELSDFAGKALGLVHRDMSPQNVFITFDGQVKVLDFGIAKVVNSQAQTSTGVLKGKVKYMAPEQMLGAPLDRRADIYAVGAMIWEAATGQRMWQGQSDLHVMHKVANEGVVSPREVAPNVLPSLDAICMMALARNPDDRYGTALELSAALESVLAELGTGASNRSLGKLVRDLFEDARAQTRAIIEAQLLEVSNTDSGQMIPPNLVSLGARVPGDDSPISQSASNSVDKSASTTAARFEDANPRKIWATAAAFGLAAAAGVGWLAAHRAPESRPMMAPVAAPPIAPPAVATTPPPAPALSASAPAGPASVSLVLSTTPARATLSLDGRVLPSNPYTATFVVDGSPHKVHAEAPGYNPRTITISPDRNADFNVMLDPIRFGARPPPVPPPPKPPPAVETPPVTRGKCNPPYFIDSDGIKKYKPDCL
jgi:serine/threonine-protein kinase